MNTSAITGSVLSRARRADPDRPGLLERAFRIGDRGGCRVRGRRRHADHHLGRRLHVGSGRNQNSAQGNSVLEAVGSNMRFNDDVLVNGTAYTV